MTAFPESGGLDRQKLGEIRVRFRPEAVNRLSQETHVSASRFAVATTSAAGGMTCPIDSSTESISSRNRGADQELCKTVVAICLKLWSQAYTFAAVRCLSRFRRKVSKYKKQIVMTFLTVLRGLARGLQLYKQYS